MSFVPRAPGKRNVPVRFPQRSVPFSRYRSWLTQGWRCRFLRGGPVFRVFICGNHAIWEIHPMNAWLSWRPDARLALHLRAMLRRAKHMSLRVFALGGCVPVLTALALWLLPAWRGSFAAKLMPLVSAAVQAGPARLLSGQPFPPFALGHQREEELRNGNAETTSLGAAATDDDSTRKLTGGLSLAVSPNGLDPRTLPTVSTLASAISAQRVVPDARDDRVLVSTHEQNLVANFIARRYHVAQEPVGELVRAAFDTGREVGLDPLLLLSVMAIESGFYPYADAGDVEGSLRQIPVLWRLARGA